MSQGSLGLQLEKHVKIYFRAFQVSLKHSLIFSFVRQDMFRQVNVLSLPLILKKNSRTSKAHLVVKNTEHKTRALVVTVAGN